MENRKATLHSLRNNNKICLVAGDFNYDILKYEQNPVINEFLNLMYSNFFKPCILEPTRVVLNSLPSLIDNIYINTYDKAIYSGNFLDKVIDHMPTFCIIEDTNRVKKNRKIRIRNMQQLEKDKFLKDLEELKNIDLLQCKNCNIVYNKFQEKYLQKIDKNIPYKILSKKEAKLRQKPWISRTILTTIKTKHILYKKYLQKQDVFWYERYKFYRNKISKLISKSKKKSPSEVFSR